MDKNVFTTIDDYFKVIVDYNEDDNFNLAFATIKEVGNNKFITFFFRKENIQQ
jgi:hypothetical protein